VVGSRVVSKGLRKKAPLAQAHGRTSDAFVALPQPHGLSMIIECTIFASDA
jgi:hypothetical protein